MRILFLGVMFLGTVQLFSVAASSGFPSYLTDETDDYRASEQLLPVLLRNPYRETDFLLFLEVAYRLRDRHLLMLLVKKHPKMRLEYKMRLYKTMTLIALKNNDFVVAKKFLAESGDTALYFPDVNEPRLLDINTAERYSTFLPGAGFVYTGDYGKAVGSFLLNALFIALTIDAYKNKNNGGALLFLFFEYQFYKGGIRAAGESATNFNNRLRQSKHDEFSAKLKIDVFSF